MLPVQTVLTLSGMRACFCSVVCSPVDTTPCAVAGMKVGSISSGERPMAAFVIYIPLSRCDIYALRLLSAWLFFDCQATHEIRTTA